MTKKLAAIKRKIDPDLITMLETALEQVKNGEIKGIVMFTNQFGDEYQFAAAGEMKMSEVIMAYESWRFDQHMLARMEKK